MTLATLPQLEDHLGVRFDADEELTGLQALEGATGVIQAYTRQTIEAVTGDVFTTSEVCNPLFLPQRPVTAVSAVVVDGVTVTSGYYAWNPFGRLYHLYQSRWSYAWPGSTIAVTYNHGYAVIPADVRMVCLAVAGRLIENPTESDRESIGSASSDYGDLLTVWDKMVLDGYTIPVFA
jgi:hypothetical protein